MNGATELASCTSSISIGSTCSTVATQLLWSTTSGSRPPASIAVPAVTRSSVADPAVNASEAMWSASRDASSVPMSADSPPMSAAGCSSEVRPMVTMGTSAARPVNGADSPSTRPEYEPGERRTVWAALLMRMSSGPAAATSSASATT